MARLLALLGALAHGTLLALLGGRTGRFPIRGAEEAFLFMAAAAAVLALALDWLKGHRILVVATLPLSFATALLAGALELTAPPPAPGAASGPSGAWTGLHVFVALASYGAFALAFVTGILYLIAQRQLKHHAAPAVFGLMPPLETVGRINVRAMAAGAALLAAGLLVGYLQARSLYVGQPPGWRTDPKIILTTATLAAYLVMVFLSRRPGFKGRRVALASIAGFFLAMTTFWASIFWSGFHNFR